MARTRRQSTSESEDSSAASEAVTPRKRKGTTATPSKQRNKVSATKALKSPDIKPAPSKEDETSVSTGGSSTSSRPGLALHVQKALAEAIESKEGGIASVKKDKEHNVSSLCSEDTETFGEYGDPIRRQIQKYVYRWRKFHEKGEYTEKVLNRFGVKSWNTRKKEARESKKQGSKITEVEDISSCSDSSSSSEKEPSRKSKSAKASKSSKPSKSAKNKPPPEITIEKEPSRKSKSAKASKSKPSKSAKNKPPPEITIETEPTAKELPRPQSSGQRSSEPKSVNKKKMSGTDIKVHPSQTARDEMPIYLVPGQPGDQGEGVSCMKLLPVVEYNGINYEGVVIEYTANSRDFAKGHFWMEYEEGSDTLEFFKPRMDSPYVEDKAEHDARQTEKTIQKAHDNARSSYSKMSIEDRTKKFTLKMPEGWQLTQKPFGVAVGSVGKVTAKIEQVTYKHTTVHTDSSSNIIYEIVYRLVWRFANASGTDDTNVQTRGGNAAVAAAYGGLEETVERLSISEPQQMEAEETKEEPVVVAAPAVPAPVMVVASSAAPIVVASAAPVAAGDDPEEEEERNEGNGGARIVVVPQQTTPTGETSSSAEPIVTKKRKVAPTPAPSAIVPVPMPSGNPYEQLEAATGSNAVDSSSLDLMVASNTEQRLVAVADIRKNNLARQRDRKKSTDRKASFKPTVRVKHDERQQDTKQRGHKKRDQLFHEKRKSNSTELLLLQQPRDDIDEPPSENSD